MRAVPWRLRPEVTVIGGDGSHDELPYLVAAELVKAMQGDRRLIQVFAPSRTYATGSQCLLELFEDRVARQRDK